MSRNVMLAVGLALFSYLAPGIGRSAQPWDVPFANQPDAILAAARAITAAEGSDVLTLLDEQRFSIDGAGRITTTIRRVYRILTEDGVAEGAAIEREYAPWHERRPELRARAITPDGAVHWLDAKTVAEAPSQQFDNTIFSDSRVLRAPIPAVLVGAVVEYELTVGETAPALAAGSYRRVVPNEGRAVQRVHVVVQAATGIPLGTKAWSIPAESIRRTEGKSGIQIEFDIGPVVPPKDFEFSAPNDDPGTPVFEFATGRSWQEIASRYSAIVDQQISGADLKEFASSLLPNASWMDAIARPTAALHKRVRYTGVEFGEAAIVPQKPAEVIRRGYGDCKDKAALLVALLRAAGLKAQVALLLPGAGLDVTADLPGFGIFSHAIVHVSHPPLWIDPTAPETRIGDLPISDQGRLALIADAGTTGLVKTPESQSTDNRAVHTVEIRLTDFGPSTVRETVQAFGSLETEMRQMYGEESKAREMLTREVKQGYGAESAGEISVTAKDDFSIPFGLSVTANRASVARTLEDDAGVQVTPLVTLAKLPYGLRVDLEKEPKARRSDFVFTEPAQVEYRYRVCAPSLFHPRPLPATEELKLGSTVLSRKYRVAEDGCIEAEYRFDTGKRRTTPAEFAEIRAGIKRVAEQGPDLLGFGSASGEALALGRVKEAVRVVHEYAKAHADSAGAQARMSRVLVAAGNGEGALAAARRAVELDPKSVQAWLALGIAYETDTFGRQFQRGWNAAEAEKAFRKVIEIEPDGFMGQVYLAELLEHGSEGIWFGPGARIREAVDLYRAALKKTPNSPMQGLLARDLLWSGQIAEADTEVKKLAESEEKETLTTVLSVVKNGAARAVIEAQNRFPDPKYRARVLVRATTDLSQIRRYEVAAELAKAVQRTGSLPETQQAAMAELAKVKPYEQTLLPPADPRSAAQQVLVAVFLHGDDVAPLEPHVTQQRREAYQAIGSGLKRALDKMRAQFVAARLPSGALFDTMMSLAEFSKEGEDAFGYRIQVGEAGVPLPTFYVVGDPGHYKVLATSWAPESLGRRAIELLKKGDTKSARRWLDWIAADSNATSNEKSPAGQLIRYLWTGGNESPLTAAASLVAKYGGSDEAIQILKQARQSSTISTERGQIDLALCEGYAQARRWADLLAAAQQASATFSVAEQGFAFVMKARAELKQWSGLEQDALQKLKKSADDGNALRAAALAAIGMGDHGKAAQYLKRLNEREYAGREAHALNAWNALLLGKVDEGMLQAVKKDQAYGSDASAFYLTGMLETALGKPEDAQQSLGRGLELEEANQLDAKAWVLFGRIQEQYGMPEAATAAYGRARSAPRADETSGWALGIIPGAR